MLAAPRFVPAPLPLLVPPTLRVERALYALIATALLVAFAYLAATFYVPAHPGVDQNGYLVGGRQIYETGKLKMAPRYPGKPDQFDPHQFVGHMWIGVDYGKPTERFYPKYPIGLPLLYAAALKIGGTTLSGEFPGWGVLFTFAVSPICMTLAMIATYLLIRLVAEPFLALIGAILVATSPTSMLLTNNPNSHASALCCVAWGMYLMLRWWQVQGIWRAFLGGFLIGFAATIRYTEALLVIPLGLVVLFYLEVWRWPGILWRWMIRRFRGEGQPRGVDVIVDNAERQTVGAASAAAIGASEQTAAEAAPTRLLALLRTTRRILRHPMVQSAALLLGWLIPVGFLAIHNYLAMGTLTGYDPTNESKPSHAFTFDYAADNWETMFRQMAVNGLFLLFPLGLLGLGWMFRWNRRLAWVMGSWIAPCLAVYTFYYWAPDNTNNIGYLRFFLTVFPALAMCAMGLVSRVAHAIGDWNPAKGWWRGPAMLLLAVLLILPLRLFALTDWFQDADLPDRFLARLAWLATNLGKDLRSPENWSVWATVLALSTLTAAVISVLFFRRATVVATGIVAAIAIAVQLQNTTYSMESEFYQKLMLDLNTRQVLRAAPAGSVLFNPDPSLVHNLQFARSYTLYGGTTFNQGTVRSMASTPNISPDDPQGLDPGRRMGLYNRLKDLDQKQLDDIQRRTVVDSLGAGKPVYVVEAPPRGNPGKFARLMTSLARKWTGAVAQKDQPLFYDVAHRWRVTVPPVAPSDADKLPIGRRFHPRAQRQSIAALSYDADWRVIQVALEPFKGDSPEKKSEAVLEHQQRIAAEKVNAEKAAADKVRRDAEKARADKLAADKAVADQLRQDAKQARSEKAVADRAAEKSKLDAEKARADAEKAKVEAEKARAQAAQALSAVAQAKAQQADAEKAAQAARQAADSVRAQQQALQVTLEQTKAELEKRIASEKTAAAAVGAATPKSPPDGQAQAASQSASPRSQAPASASLSPTTAPARQVVAATQAAQAVQGAPAPTTRKTPRRRPTSAPTSQPTTPDN